MAEISDGGPAFPCEQHETLSGTWNQTFEPGMSLRDYFAGQALQGLLAADARYGGRTDNRDALANDAYVTADAMLRARAALQGAKP